jgi:hypothetical protein
MLGGKRDDIVVVRLQRIPATFWVDIEKDDAVDRDYPLRTSARAPAANTAGRARHVGGLLASSAKHKHRSDSRSRWYVWSTSPVISVFVNTTQESPHEHQQNVLLSRIITNVVRR